MFTCISATLELDLCKYFWGNSNLNFFWIFASFIKCRMVTITYAVHIIKWYKFVAVVLGSLLSITIMTFRRLVVQINSTNWFKVARFGGVIPPFLSIVTLNQCNLIDSRFILKWTFAMFLLLLILLLLLLLWFGGYATGEFYPAVTI